jgi:hypothetical protein
MAKINLCACVVFDRNLLSDDMVFVLYAVKNFYNPTKASGY